MNLRQHRQRAHAGLAQRMRYAADRFGTRVGSGEARVEARWMLITSATWHGPLPRSRWLEVAAVAWVPRDQKLPGAAT